jgi:pantetheine-phosphate adenylyltransferase
MLGMGEFYQERIDKLHENYGERIKELNKEIAELKKAKTSKNEEAKKQKTAIFPLSADPVHNGHVYTLKYATESGFFDKVYFAIGVNPFKKTLFSVEERKNLAKRVLDTENLGDKVEIISYEGLLRNYAKVNGIEYAVRGYRNGKDAEYEAELADFNSEYGLKTWVVPAANGNKGISSTMVKAAVSEFALVHKEVHPAVKQALEERLRRVSLVGVTGNMGCGKSTLCEKLVEYSQTQKDKINHIDFDKLVHSVYFDNTNLGKNVRETIRKEFGDDLFEKDNLNRKKLAAVVFGDKQKRDRLAEILKVPSMIKLEEKLREMKGIVLIDAAYLVEYNMLPIVNYNTILVTCNEDERAERVFKRDGITREDFDKRIKAQYPEDTKRNAIKEAQAKNKHGFFLEINTSNPADYKLLYDSLAGSFPLLKEAK